MFPIKPMYDKKYRLQHNVFPVFDGSFCDSWVNSSFGTNKLQQKKMFYDVSQ